MARYVLSINEQSKRGKLVKQLLKELKDEKNIFILNLEEFEALEDKAIAREIKKAEKGPELTAEKARQEFSRLRRKFRK